MAANSQDAPRHAGQVVRRVLLRRNIAIDAETAQLVAAAVQAALQAPAPSRRPRPAPARSRRRQRAAVLIWARLSAPRACSCLTKKIHASRRGPATSRPACRDTSAKCPPGLALGSAANAPPSASRARQRGTGDLHLLPAAGVGPSGWTRRRRGQRPEKSGPPLPGTYPVIPQPLRQQDKRYEREIDHEYVQRKRPAHHVPLPNRQERHDHADYG